MLGARKSSVLRLLQIHKPEDSKNQSKSRFYRSRTNLKHLAGQSKPLQASPAKSRSSKGDRTPAKQASLVYTGTAAKSKFHAEISSYLQSEEKLKDQKNSFFVGNNGLGKFS